MACSTKVKYLSFNVAYAKKIDEAWVSKYEHYFRDSLSQQNYILTYGFLYGTINLLAVYKFWGTGH